jgi:hypothetical protein
MSINRAQFAREAIMFARSTLQGSVSFSASEIIVYKTISWGRVLKASSDVWMSLMVVLLFFCPRRSRTSRSRGERRPHGAAPAWAATQRRSLTMLRMRIMEAWQR